MTLALTSMTTKGTLFSPSPLVDPVGFSGVPGTGPYNDFIDVTIRQPEYTPAYNWAEVTRSNRSDGIQNNTSHSVLFYDGGRGATVDPTAPLSDYDMQGIAFITWITELLVLPTATISNNQTVCSGAFWRADTYGTHRQLDLCVHGLWSIFYFQAGGLRILILINSQ